MFLVLAYGSPWRIICVHLGRVVFWVWIFCLDNVSIVESGVLPSPTIVVTLSISPFRSASNCLIYIDTLMCEYIFTLVIWWPFFVFCYHFWIKSVLSRWVFSHSLSFALYNSASGTVEVGGAVCRDPLFSPKLRAVFPRRKEGELASNTWWKQQRKRMTIIGLNYTIPTSLVNTFY